MAKSAVTENIPKQTEFERDQHKVRVVSKTKAIWVRLALISISQNDVTSFTVFVTFFGSVRRSTSGSCNAWTWRFRRNIGACHRNNNVSHYFAERDSLLRLLRFLRDNNVMVYNVSGFSQGLVNNRSLTFDSSFILKWNQTYQFERVWKPIIINSVQKVCWSFWSMESAPYMKVTFG